MMDCALIGGGWNNRADDVSGYGAFRDQGSGYDVMWSQDEYKNSHPPPSFSPSQHSSSRSNPSLYQLLSPLVFVLHY